MELLHIENLSFTYPNAACKALDGVTLDIAAGDFVVICGASGCGKTTLLRLLKRELAPFGEKSGRILYDGAEQDAPDDHTAAAEIGYVLQNPEQQIVTDKVWHELAFGLENLGLPTAVIRRRVAEMASYFGIQGWFRQNTADLSGGQKQLLNLAAIMAMQPRVLLLDEPTSQLDPIAAADFIATLQKLNRELGLTILLVEHRLEEVFPIADKVLVLDEGRVLLYDTPRTVGERLKLWDDRTLPIGLPSAVRIYQGLEIDAPCPLTVRDGRRFLNDHFEAGAPREDVPAYIHRNETALELRDVWFRYERGLPDVLRGVSFSVYEGELFCLLGGNGVGKSTILQVAAGLHKPYRGRVMVGGKPLSAYKGQSLYRQNVAMLPQDPQTVFLRPTVKEDLEEPAAVMYDTKAEQAQAVTQVADKLGIGALLGRHPYDLSGGEQQKCALAKLLLTKPRLLLLDEPTKGLDASAKQELAALLRGLNAEGITVVVVTHDVEFAAENAHRCAMVFDGEITSADTPTAFFSQNTFYTTAANRIARHLYPDAVTCGDVIEQCRQNGRRL